MPIKPENYKLIRRHFIKLFNQECAICKVKCDENGKYNDDGVIRQMEFDHIKPNGYYRNQAGTSKRTWEWFVAYQNKNLQMLCKFCNISKNDN